MVAEYRLTLFTDFIHRHERLNTGLKKKFSAFSESLNKMRVKELKKKKRHKAKENGETTDSGCYQNVGNWKADGLVIRDLLVQRELKPKYNEERHKNKATQPHRKLRDWGI